MSTGSVRVGIVKKFEILVKIECYYYKDQVCLNFIRKLTTPFNKAQNLTDDNRLSKQICYRLYQFGTTFIHVFNEKKVLSMIFQFIKNSEIIIDFEKLCLNQITHFKPIKKTLVQKSCRANYSINRLMCFGGK